MRKIDILTIAMLLGVMLVCGIAMLVTGRDNTCTERGGHVRGMLASECVVK